jgi:hypothetical protein
MKSTLNRRLRRLEGTRRGVASLSDEELELAIDLLVAQLDGRTLTPSEAAEAINLPPSYRRRSLRRRGARDGHLGAASTSVGASLGDRAP